MLEAKLYHFRKYFGPLVSIHSFPAGGHGKNNYEHCQGLTFGVLIFEDMKVPSPEGPFSTHRVFKTNTL